MSARLFVLLTLVLVAVFDWSANYAELPEWMATNFGAEGRPGGWMKKTTATWVFLGMFGFLATTFGVLPWLIRRAPASLINIPNRHYWLQPEHRSATLATLERFIFLVNVLTLVFFIVVHHLVIEANLLPEPRLNDVFLPLMFGYLGILTVLIVWLLLTFRRPNIE